MAPALDILSTPPRTHRARGPGRSYVPPTRGAVHSSTMFQVIGPCVSLAKKLQIPAGQGVCLLNAPRGLDIDAPITRDPSAGAVLLFARDSMTLKGEGRPVFEAARADRLAWIAYPKAGQLGTDLNRDILWELLKPQGIRPVRQISIDEVWSALRFRPG